MSIGSLFSHFLYVKKLLLEFLLPVYWDQPILLDLSRYNHSPTDLVAIWDMLSGRLKNRRGRRWKPDLAQQMGQ